MAHSGNVPMADCWPVVSTSMAPQKQAPRWVSVIRTLHGGNKEGNAASGVNGPSPPTKKKPGYDTRRFARHSKQSEHGCKSAYAGSIPTSASKM